ncbi:MAG: HipA N-terminal domain-containing protein [Terrimonas ferruginea]|uniref:HipA N-terminal domain-containing protein n=1 Tax=Terrimonas ferruginea TaxID=249 RepID=UPI0009289BFF|nr:HipA N-terminal domain-containing protein [Terrimonas ferruginea]MBN8782179.1 HipA N-terminal domain-containing protein [Terrimonas ferruginea]OJW42714.1 MAG: phosphatidylinositol kinase [Sphingobacteriales bacterium 48-107]
MRSGRVYFKGIRAGTVWQNEDGYGFQYNQEYLGTADAEAVSLTLPLSAKPFLSKTMIPFFDGLIPEGWLLDIAIQNWKLDNRDRMGLLLVACKDCIGAVSIEAESEIENE